VRALGLGTFVIVVLAISALLDRESGIRIWLELREDLSGSAVRVEQLARENDALRREIELLETDPAALERAIREELDLARPGEIVVRFEKAASAESSDAAAPDRVFTRRISSIAGAPDREAK
jgi:cell division protein FtsB